MKIICKLCAISWAIGMLSMIQSIFVILTNNYNLTPWMFSKLVLWTFTLPTFFFFIPIFIYNGFYQHVMITFSEYIVAFHKFKTFFKKSTF